MIALNRIFAPNAFTPGAAKEIDRVFLPYCNGVLEKGYHLKILSRWNDVIFECRNEFKGWTGQLADGSMAPPGNYIWVLYFEDFLEKFHYQSGNVTLVY
jgi:hypothetical protein